MKRRGEGVPTRRQTGRGIRDGELTGEHLVKHAGETVLVRPAVDGRLPDRLFGTHVGASAHGESGSGDSIPAGGADGSGDAEVGDDGSPAREQDVLRLDVAVHHAVRMSVAQRTRDLVEDLERVVDRQPDLAVESVSQGLAIDARHHVVQQAIRFARVVQRENVGMLQMGGDVDLLEEPFGPERRRQVGAKQLEGHQPPMLEVLGEVDCGHPAAPELAVDGVAARQ